MGEACRGLSAGPRPRPAGRGGAADGLNGTCAMPVATRAVATRKAAEKNIAASLLFTRISGFFAPAEAVRFPMQGLQCASVIRNRARRINRHVHYIAYLERVPLDPLLTQLTGRPPLDRPALHHSLVILRLNLQKRVWIPKEEVDNRPLKFDLSVRIIGRGQRVVAIGRRAENKHPRESEKRQFASHRVSCYFLVRVL